MILSLFVGFILGAAAFLFALQNIEPVSLSFMGAQFESSLAVVVLCSVAVGILISLLAALPSALGSSFRIMGLKSENKKLRQVIEQQPTVIVQSPDAIPPVVDLR